ncbi:protein Wnt-5-like isoform X2 [Drosophila busckii]|nr:protein Wnt-5-like isoform X2 [Drosophila busckii]XP_033150678.1 protein Wnt-5-like isoform X2 [Drosophila busckii]
MPELQSFEQKQQKHKLINIDNARSSRETNINLSTHGGIQQSVTEAQAENKVNPLMLSTQPSLVSLPKQGSGSENKKNLGLYINPDDLLQLQERISKEILNSKLQEKEMIELQDKINREILSSNLFNGDSTAKRRKHKRKNSRAVTVSKDVPVLSSANLKARSLMNLHNNEAGRRAVIKKTRITCKCHGVSGSCSLITCWQQLSSIREIGDYLREKYEEATEVKLNKRGRLQVKNSQFKIPTAHDLIYLDESPDWCRTNRLLQWSGTHGRVCNKTSSGLDGCGILCCGRGYNTKNIVVRERCNCKFHWCCQVKCEACTKILEEHTCK